MYKFVDEDGGNFNAIDKNFTVTRLKRTFSFKYTSSTYFRRGSNAEPFDQAQLLAFSFEQFAHRRRPLCAHLSVSTDSFVGVRACIDFSKRATVSPPLPFFFFPSSFNFRRRFNKRYRLLIAGIFSRGGGCGFRILEAFEIE